MSTRGASPERCEADHDGPTCDRRATGYTTRIDERRCTLFRSLRLSNNLGYFRGPDAHQITEFVLGSSELDPEQSTRVGYTSLPKADLEYFFDLDGGVLYTGMDWSPDGQKLLVSFHGEDYQNDSSDIFLYDRTTKTLQSIAATDADESGPKWSPDGNWFVYVLNPSGADNTELVFASLDTACTIRQTVDSGLMDVSWGHPDLLLVLHRNALYRVDLQLAFGFGQDTIGDHCPN